MRAKSRNNIELGKVGEVRKTRNKNCCDGEDQAN